MSSFTDIYFKRGEYKLVRSSYLNNGYLAVVAFSNIGECIGSVTVNIKGDKLEKNEAYLDENNLPGIGDVLEREMAMQHVLDFVRIVGFVSIQNLSLI